MKKIAIIGAGGLGREVASIIKSINEIDPQWEMIGFFGDFQTLKGTSNEYGPILGSIEEMNQIDEQLHVVIAIGKGESILKIRNRINHEKFIFPNIVHPTTLFMDKDTTQMGEGNVFSAHCIVSCAVEIGSYNVFNTRVTLGHDDKIGNYNIFSPNVHMSGNISIGDLNYFGFNSGVIQGRKIGSNNILGAGSILLRNVKDGNTYMGNPAIKIKF